MDTPICDFVRDYAASQPQRLHMPGHKGCSILGCEDQDITEIPGADVLYHAQGIIRRSQENASALFGTGKTLYSAEGSSLAIRAMLYLTLLYAKQRGMEPVIAAGRNAHKVFITAAALLDIPVRWLMPEGQGSLISCAITPAQLEAALKGEEKLPAAVYITSPDYLGNLSDLAGLSAVCRKYGCLLLVDNAHGAYLHFLPRSLHPMDLGADLCCDSAHKTLPVLTGGAYLHIRRGAPEELTKAAEQAMALFASTSPSYLILQSLDSANAYLSQGFREDLEQAIPVWEKLRQKLKSSGFTVAGQEPLKLTLLPKSYGYTGEELSDILEKQNIYCEFADPDHLVLMLPVQFDADLPGRLEEILLHLPRRSPIELPAPVISLPEQAVTARQALMSPSCQIPTLEALGRIMASPTVSCPPAIPIVSCGERIEQWAVEAMAYYGIENIRVLK